MIQAIMWPLHNIVWKFVCAGYDFHAFVSLYKLFMEKAGTEDMQKI